MTSLPRRARLALLAIAVLLLSPAIGGFFSDHEARSNYEKRQLTTWSAVSAQWGSKSWFATLDAFIDDHLAFATRLNALYQKTLFYVFRDVSVDNITLGDNGFVFLNAHDFDSPHGNLRRTCSASTDFLRRAHNNLSRIDAWLAARDIPVTFAFVPTKPILYADALPDSVPADVRERCIQAAANPAQIFTTRLREKARESGLQVYYPVEAMKYGRNVEAFYPPGNYHANSMLNHAFALGLLRRLDIRPVRSEFSAGAYLGEVTADLPTLGFRRKLRAWVYPYEHYGIERIAREPAWITDVYPGVRHFSSFQTERPVSSRRALLLTNSFGNSIAPHLAPGFEHMLQVSLNHIRDEDRLSAFTGLLDGYKPSDVIFVMHDGGQPFIGLEKLARGLAPVTEGSQLPTGH